MNIKLFDLNKDYLIIENWCAQHQWPVISKSMLSTFGYLVSLDSKPIAVTWLYPIMGSDLCWLGYTISDKTVDKQIRKEALDLLFDTVFLTAKDMGYKNIITTSDTPPIIERLKQYGFVEGDKNINQYIGVL